MAKYRIDDCVQIQTVQVSIEFIKVKSLKIIIGIITIYTAIE